MNLYTLSTIIPYLTYSYRNSRRREQLVAHFMDSGDYIQATTTETKDHRFLYQISFDQLGLSFYHQIVDWTLPDTRRDSRFQIDHLNRKIIIKDSFPDCISLIIRNRLTSFFAFGEDLKLFQLSHIGRAHQYVRLQRNRMIDHTWPGISLRDPQTDTWFDIPIHDYCPIFKRGEFRDPDPWMFRDGIFNFIT